MYNSFDSLSEGRQGVKSSIGTLSLVLYKDRSLVRYFFLIFVKGIVQCFQSNTNLFADDTCYHLVVDNFQLAAKNYSLLVSIKHNNNQHPAFQTFAFWNAKECVSLMTAADSHILIT